MAPSVDPDLNPDFTALTPQAAGGALSGPLYRPCFRSASNLSLSLWCRRLLTWTLCRCDEADTRPPSWDSESPPSSNALEWIGLTQSLVEPPWRCLPLPPPSSVSIIQTIITLTQCKSLPSNTGHLAGAGGGRRLSIV